MSVQDVKQYLRQYGKENDVRELDASSATVELAAQALGVEPARIAKTLSFKAPDGCILVVAAGDAKVDNKKFKEAFGCKAKMLSAEEVEPLTGHAVGGVCPFANPETVKVYIDVSVKRFASVFPACGSANSAVQMTCDELFGGTRAEKWVDVCKSWQAETAAADA